MPHTILVTGAAGFAGGHLLERLAVAPVAPGDLVAWHRPGSLPPPGPGATSWTGVDLLDPLGVDRAIAALRPATVYHCAGAAHVGHSWGSTETTLAINVLGTHHLLDALRRHAAGAVVMIPSSAMVYQPIGHALVEDAPTVPNSPYGISKLAQERLAGRTVADGLDVRIARPFNHLGPRQDPQFVASGFARRIADIEAGRWEAEIAVGNLDAQRDLTDVRDTVAAYHAIATRGITARPYNVCSGRATAIGDLLEMLLGRARVPIRVRVDPARLRPNDVPVLLGDRSRITAELGWTPAIPLERTLDDLLDYWRHRTP